MKSQAPSKWWIPSKPDQAVPGNLFEDEDDGWKLELAGYLPSPGADDDGFKFLWAETPTLYRVIVGVTSSGEYVTLLDSWVVAVRPPMSSASGSLVVSPGLIVRSVHLDSWDDFRITSLAARFNHLDTWVSTSGFTQKIGDGERSLPWEVRYSTPEALIHQRSDGIAVGINFSANWAEFSVTDAHIRQQAWIQVKSEKPRPYSELNRVQLDLAALVTLGVGQPLRHIEESVNCITDDGEVVSCAVVHNAEQLTPKRHKVVHPWEMLFTLPEIRPDFSRLAETWLERSAAFSGLCDLYFGTIRSPFMYVEHRLMNMFHALESYDRRTRQLETRRREEHEQRLAEIYAASPKHKSWLVGKLRYSHEPAARDRIAGIVKTLDADWLMSNAEIDTAGDLRNYYTHYDPRVESRLPPRAGRSTAIHNIAAKMRILIEMLLLEALGFPLHDIRARMQKTRRVEHLTIPASRNQS